MRRTWAPRGRTPLLRHRQRRDRISVISGVSVSPRRRRYGLYFLLATKNLQHPEVCQFLRQLLRHLRGPVIVIWDNGKIHGGDAIRALQARYPSSSESETSAPTATPVAKSINALADGLPEQASPE